MSKIGIFHFILVGIPSSLILFLKKQGVGFFTYWAKSVKWDKIYLLILPIHPLALPQWGNLWPQTHLFSKLKKSKPLKISHYFFFITSGDSTSFLMTPWNFHILFFQYPWKFHVLNAPVWIFYGIAL